MTRNDEVLSLFHPLISQWFRERIGQPTEVQKLAWPQIASGEHILITAPTGSGKTLTAFLWALNQLITRKCPIGYTSVLYVSPLKALNNDIHRNLLHPLAELRSLFAQSDLSFPDIRVQTRSGDTPQSDRRRMQRHPPEILITTPESLNLLLSSFGGRSFLSTISTVILDEIHAVVGQKRGVHLITAVDRLVPLCGEFQRIALSATIKPLDMVAEFVGGFRAEGSIHNPKFTPRTVSIVRSSTAKKYDIQVRFPEEAVNREVKESIWEPLVSEFQKVIGRNSSTLFFTNSRRLCEKITLKINNGAERLIAYAHHGSLSREIRETVEGKLKAGELKAIVATNSLELGIDIGALDEVILIQSPPSVSSAIQRVGRARHQVGQISRGTLYPTHSQDLLEAAVLAAEILKQDIEEIRPVESPLDVLAQVIISMVGVECWDMDALYTQVRTSYPYRNLGQEPFKLLLNMLAGGYADSRIRELKPRVSIDRLDNTVRIRKGALLALYTSGGTIPDRGYFHLRHQKTNALIGELDEEFVWEASIGQTLTLGTQNWKIERITHNDVFVTPARPKSMAIPFWKGEENHRDFHFSEKIGYFLEMANERLDDPNFMVSLEQDYYLESSAAEQLINFLKNQKEKTQCDLPHRHHMLIELVGAGPGLAPGNQLIWHTFWGGRVNSPLAMALEAAWEERFGQRLEIYTGNDCLVLVLPEAVGGEEVLSLVTSANVEKLLRKRLEGSGFFGARFRECAGRALLLSRNKLNQRMPLWMNRLKSQKLLDAVLPYDNFPILLETWRTCLQDEFDLPNLKEVLTELEAGSIRWTQIHTNYPSPMAQNMTWRQINDYMYRDDTPSSGKTSKLRDDLLRDLVFTPDLRPAVKREIIEQFELKRRRLSPGYAPESEYELIDWVKERLLLPAPEWEKLLQAMHDDHGIDVPLLLNKIAPKLVRIIPAKSSETLIAALEAVPKIIFGFYGSAEKIEIEPLLPMKNHRGIASQEFLNGKKPEWEVSSDEVLISLLGEWLQFYGPIKAEFICETLGVEYQRLSLSLEDLLESRDLIAGQLVADDEDEYICDSENFEILLRIARSRAIPVFEPLPVDSLPLFLAHYQGITHPENSLDGLFQRLLQLLCFSLPVNLWESEILPARLHPYDPSWLDTIMQEGELRWIGGRSHGVAFCFDSDSDLLQEASGSQGQGDMQSDDIDDDQPNEERQRPGTAQISDLISDAAAKYDFSTLLHLSGLSPSELVERLWHEVWQGKISNDTFLVLRRGMASQFKVPHPTETPSSSHHRARLSGVRSHFFRWKNSSFLPGNWFRLPISELWSDLLQIEELKKARIRLLLDRYGILFRELLEKELPLFQWKNVSRTLRLMELSGEVLAGCFFHGIPGLQFISHQAFQSLQRKLPEDKIYWLNAADPASLCGVQLQDLKGSLPKRSDSTHLVYRGKQLVLVSKSNGKSLTFQAPPDDPHLQSYLMVLRHLLSRQFQPLRRLTIESINGEEAVRSPYVDALSIAFETVIDYKSVILYRTRMI